MRHIDNPWIGIKGYECFGCAPTNNNGLKMTFYKDEESGEVVSVLKPRQHHQGWINTMHGGIQTTILDEACAWAVMEKYAVSGVTSKMDARFLKPILTTDPYIVVRGRTVEKRRNLVTVEAEIYNTKGEVCSKCTCLFFTYKEGEGIVVDIPKAQGSDLTLEEIISSI